MTRKFTVPSVLSLLMGFHKLCLISEACVSEVNDWMASHFLKLNADKTEVFVICFRTQLAKSDLSFMKLADADVAVQSNPIRSLGVMFDSGMTMAAQVFNIVKSAIYLVNIGRARRLLTDDAIKLAIHTLVTSRLDYCNSLLIGISLRLQRKLQNIHRTSSRLITKRRKFDSITSQLIELITKSSCLFIRLFTTKLHLTSRTWSKLMLSKDVFDLAAQHYSLSQELTVWLLETV